MNETTAILAALTALFAVVLGPLVTMHVTRRQIEASVLAKNRQEWINTLRGELTELIVWLRSMRLVMQLPREHIKIDELKGFLEKITRCEVKISLLINPNEKDHAELVRLISEGLNLAADAQNHPSERITEIEKQITALSQQILKREWQRVKAAK